MHPRRCFVTAALALVFTMLVTSCAPQPTAVPRAPGAPVTQASDPSPSDGPTATPSLPSEPVGTPSEAPVPAPEPTVDPTVAPAPTVDPTTEAPPVVVLTPGDRGDDVRDLQHRLLQIQWLDGPVTDTYGDQTRAAVEGFQAKRELPVTGVVDENTLERLHAMTRQPTHDEMYNILRPGPAILQQGDKSAEVRDLQSRLRQIGWFSGDVTDNYGEQTKAAVSGFQEKRGFPVTGEVDQRTLDRLHEMTRKPTSDELNNVIPKGDTGSLQLDPRCVTGRAVCISKQANKLAWVVDGNVEMVVDVRFGSTRTPTREGTFSVLWKSRDHHSSLYDSPMPFALFFSGGQAVHYSADFARRGYSGASHGCVNVRDREAVERLFGLAKVGDKVIVY